MRKIWKLTIILLVIWLFSYAPALATSGNGRGQRIPTYTVSTAFKQFNLNQSVQVTVSLAGGQADTKYTFNVTVIKPDQVTNSSAANAITTDGNGNGVGEISYPSAFHGSKIAPATDQVGTYKIRVDQTLPKYKYGVAASSFTITSTLLLNILEPTAGVSIDRGANVSFAVQVEDINGNPQSSANVSALLPGQRGTIEISQSQQSDIYAGSYQIKWNDPSGLWDIEYVARDTCGNKGEASAAVNITSTNLSIQKLNAFDTTGQSRLTFYNNETVNFQVEAYYPDGSIPGSGAASLGIIDPTGRLDVTLALIYNPQIDAYRTLTGYQLNQTVMFGTWTATIYANGLGDGFGNQGPLAPVSLVFNVAPAPTAYGNSQNPIQRSDAFNFLPLMLIGMLGVVPVAAWKWKGRAGKRDDLDLLIQGASAAGFTLIEGAKRTGKSTAGYMIACRSAEKGQKVVLLSFENSPSTIRTRMLQIGADSNVLEEEGNLQIIDCSDVSESLNIGYLRSKLMDALDGKSQRTTIIIDSLDLLYDDLEEKEIQDLLIGLRNEARSLNGLLYATVTSSSSPPQLLSALERVAGMVLQAEKSPRREGLSTILKVKKTANATAKSSGDTLTLEGLARNPNSTGQFGRIA